jgi:hypothetical protein
MTVGLCPTALEGEPPGKFHMIEYGILPPLITSVNITEDATQTGDDGAELMLVVNKGACVIIQVCVI